MSKKELYRRTEQDKLSANAVSIESYLRSRGLEIQGHHMGLLKCSSPFSNDTVASFVIYPNNRYYDFSTGHGGDTIHLVQRLEGCGFRDAIQHLLSRDSLSTLTKQQMDRTYVRKPFNLASYLNTNTEEVSAIKLYAAQRKIYEEYLCGVYFTKEEKGWKRNPCLLFPHTDINRNICGCKMRNIYPKGYEHRFQARGKLDLYILENFVEGTFDNPVLYIVESESSANSLWSYFKSNNINVVVISGGGVSNPPKAIPADYEQYERKIIIDYDGSEELYKQRCELYSHLGGEAIKLILPRGDDINSLWINNKMSIVVKLIM